MKETYISFLMSPMTLLFFINALFLTLGSSLLWNYLSNIKYSKILNDLPEIQEKNPILIKSVLLFPVLVIATLLEYKYSLLQQMNFFPLFYSPFIRENLIIVLMALTCLVFIKYWDNKNRTNNASIIIFFVAYMVVIYLFYLILLMATVVMRLNLFPDNLFKNYAPAKAYQMNQLIVGVLYLINWIFILIVLLLKSAWRQFLFVSYFFVISLISYFVE